jgi:hypothetical protein
LYGSHCCLDEADFVARPFDQAEVDGGAQAVADVTLVGAVL